MVLFVKVKANQHFDRVEKLNEHYLIRITAPAQNGAANKYLLEYLSRVLNVSKSRIDIKSGLSSTHKYIVIDADETYVHNVLSGKVHK